MSAAENIPTCGSARVFDDLDTVRSQMIVALLSTVCMVCAAYAINIQIRRGLKGARKFLIIATTVMYIATTASWTSSLVGQFQSLTVIKSDLLDSDSFSSLGITIQDYVGTGALTISVFIGDSIVWWRVWILWNQKRCILIISFVVLFSTLALGVVSYLFTPGSFFFTGEIGAIVIGLSLFSNLASTLLVGYKSWRHRINTKSLELTPMSSVNQVHRVLILLFESGAIYCIIWVIVLSSEIWKITPNKHSQWLWMHIMKYFIEGSLVALVGIYPTLIVILTALNKSEIEEELTFRASVQHLPVSLPLLDVTRPILARGRHPHGRADWIAHSGRF